MMGEPPGRRSLKVEPFDVTMPADGNDWLYYKCGCQTRWKNATLRGLRFCHKHRPIFRDTKSLRRMAQEIQQSLVEETNP